MGISIIGGSGGSGTDSKSLGQYTSLTALELANPAPEAGSYGYVNVPGEDIVKYIWDDDDLKYVAVSTADSTVNKTGVTDQYIGGALKTEIATGWEYELRGFSCKSTYSAGAPFPSNSFVFNENENLGTSDINTPFMAKVAISGFDKLNVATNYNLDVEVQSYKYNESSRSWCILKPADVQILQDQYLFSESDAEEGKPFFYLNSRTSESSDRPATVGDLVDIVEQSVNNDLRYITLMATSYSSASKTISCVIPVEYRNIISQGNRLFVENDPNSFYKIDSKLSTNNAITITEPLALPFVNGADTRIFVEKPVAEYLGEIGQHVTRMIDLPFIKSSLADVSSFIKDIVTVGTAASAGSSILNLNIAGKTSIGDYLAITDDIGVNLPELFRVDEIGNTVQTIDRPLPFDVEEDSSITVINGDYSNFSGVDLFKPVNVAVLLKMSESLADDIETISDKVDSSLSDTDLALSGKLSNTSDLVLDDLKKFSNGFNETNCKFTGQAYPPNNIPVPFPITGAVPGATTVLDDLGNVPAGTTARRIALSPVDDPEDLTTVEMYGYYNADLDGMVMSASATNKTTTIDDTLYAAEVYPLIVAGCMIHFFEDNASDVTPSSYVTRGYVEGLSFDMTDEEIKAGYESNADTNVFSDAEKTKVANLPSNTSTSLAAKADLVSGKIPASQLPASVDDVLEYSSLTAFPSTGSSSVIYIAIDTNKTYRWGGSSYVPIGSDLALGETSSTAHRGDRGKSAYDHSLVTTGNPHNLNTDDVNEGSTNLYYTEARVSGNSNVVANTAKVGITTAQASAITANTAKITYPASASTKLAGIETGAEANNVNDTQAGYVNTLTSNAQTQLNGKEDKETVLPLAEAYLTPAVDLIAIKAYNSSGDNIIGTSTTFECEVKVNGNVKAFTVNQVSNETIVLLLDDYTLKDNDILNVVLSGDVFIEDYIVDSIVNVINEYVPVLSRAGIFDASYTSRFGHVWKDLDGKVYAGSRPQFTTVVDGLVELWCSDSSDGIFDVMDRTDYIYSSVSAFNTLRSYIDISNQSDIVGELSPYIGVNYLCFTGTGMSELDTDTTINNIVTNTITKNIERTLFTAKNRTAASDEDINILLSRGWKIDESSVITARSVIFDIADNHGSSNYTELRSVDFYLSGVKIELTDLDFITYSTTNVSSSTWGTDNIFETALSKVGENSWVSWRTTSVSDNRIIVVFNNDVSFDQIIVNNSHAYGTLTNVGINNTKITYSGDVVSDTAYNSDISGGVVIFDSSVPSHNDKNEEDPYEISFY